MGFSRQEYWSGLPLLSPGDLPNPGIKPGLTERYTSKKRFLITVNQNICVVMGSGIYGKRVPVTLAQYTFRCRQNNTPDWHMDTQI